MWSKYFALRNSHTRTYRMLKRRLFMAAAVLLSGVGAVAATDVLMEGVDTARTGWVRDEKVFTLANVASTKLIWKVQLNSSPRSMHNLFPPLVAQNVQTPQGVLEVGLVAGVTDDLFAVNLENGQVLWRRRFENRLAN
jgi:outer membrane protein assembly factor BamB